MSRSNSLRQLRSRIDGLLLQFEKAHGALPCPVDLESVCNFVGVAVEWRWMVPEGVLGVHDDGLKIYLQSNFRDRAGVRKRQRFTWAHEICHALFYQTGAKPPKLIPGTPKGAQLEKLCQQGAGYILIPTELLSRDFTGNSPVSSIEDIKSLATKYDVSVDVVLKRLHEVDSLLRNNYAVLLTRRKEGREVIDAACYGPWLKLYFDSPGVGSDFERWAASYVASAKSENGDVWVMATPDGSILMRRRKSSESQIVELEHCPQ